MSPINWFPFFLRYGNILPSSFSMVISTPESIRLVHQCRFWVRLKKNIKPFPEIEQKDHLSNLVSSFISICQFDWIHHFNVFTWNLEADSLCAEKRTAETLELTAIMIFTWFFRYSCQYIHFWILQEFSQTLFIGLQNASLPLFLLLR